MKSKIYNDFLHFIKSTDFAKAVTIAVAIVTPIFIGYETGYFEAGLAIGVGSLLSSPSDISGSAKHKRIGILISAFIAVISSIIGGYLPSNVFIQIPILGITMFLMAYFAIYGFRASLVGFSGLFALVLSFAKLSTVLQPYERAILIGVGGLWYLLLTSIVDFLAPKKQTEEFLTQSLNLTADYLKIRALLFKNPTFRKKGFSALLELQSSINENHEKLREILINSRKSAGDSLYESKRLLVLIQLIDILELAMANPVNYEKMDELLEKYAPQKEAIHNLVMSMSARLKNIAYAIERGKSLKSDGDLKHTLEQINSSMGGINNHLNAWDEGYITLKNLYDYQEQQIEKINTIEHILSTKEVTDLNYARNKVSRRFLTQQDYNPDLLLENLSWQSPIFKHALRLAVVIMIGFAVGSIFKLQNPYWILLTIIVIMRPNYGLTKSRSIQRIIGTVIGAVIAVGIVLLVHNLMLFRILAILSLICAFATLQKNYRTAAIFITLSVVFVYALLKPEVFEVIEFRVLDTGIGAALAALGNIFLWPSWEALGIRNVFTTSLEKNRLFLEEIATHYQKKGTMPTSYKLSRKQAFLATGELNAAMQRMSQEPSSQQKNFDTVYELVILNQTFLSALASLSTYIQNHATTEASSHFNSYTKSIVQNLKQAESMLQHSKIDIDLVDHKEAEDYMQKRFEELSDSVSEYKYVEVQEAQLIKEQLRWLRSISGEIIDRIKDIDGL